MLSGCRFLRDASPRRAIGTVLSCMAGTTMISTALADADALNVRAPPVWISAAQGADSGPTISPALSAQAAVGFPVIVSAFFAMKLPSGLRQCQGISERITSVHAAGEWCSSSRHGSDGARG